MVILDITKKNGTKCTRMCDRYDYFDDGDLYMFSYSFKIPHDDETIMSNTKTIIRNVIYVKEVKRV